MSFAYPYVLLLLALPVLVLVWQWRHPGQRVVLPFDHGVQRRGRFLQAAVNLAHSLPALILAVVVVLLAGPQQLTEPRSKRVLTNIQFCVDVSGSMTSQFGEGNRYDAAMESILEFITYREGDAFGLTIFGTDILHWVPLTNDPSAFQCAPPFLQPMQLPRWFGGGTRIGMALTECTKLIVRREEGDRMIILLSDGYSSDLGGGRDEELAREMSAENIVVYAVHIGPGDPPAPLVNITSLTGGEVFAAGDPEGLKSIFKRIDEMQEVKLEKSSAETMDYFWPFAVAGLALLGLQALTHFGLRYTPW